MNTLHMSVQRKPPVMKMINQPIFTGSTRGTVLKYGGNRDILGKDLIKVASMQFDFGDKGLCMKLHFCPRLTLVL